MDDDRSRHTDIFVHPLKRVLKLSGSLSDIMNFSRDDRGVSEVLGAILVFALLISVLSIVQVSGVPALNEQVEFEHNADVQGDMRGFAAGVDSAAATGRDQPATVKTGVRYPPRLFLLNPGPTAGTLSTTGESEVRFGNLEALDPEAGQFLDSANAPAPYTTTGLTYQPNYNEYTAAPETRYEHGIVYNVDADGGVSVMDRGAVVSGKRVSLTTLDGSLATSGGDAVSLTVSPVSAPSHVVPVRGAGGDPLTLTLGTNLSAETWETVVLADEMDTGPDDGRYVTSVVCANGNVTEPCNDELTITFEPGTTYDLRLAKVAISGGVGDEPPAYLTKVGPASPAVQPGGTDLTVELRDRYNNPVAGKEISFRITGGNAAFSNGATGTTDADGRVTVTVDPTDNTSLTVDAWHDANDNDARDDGPEFTVEYNSLAVADNAQAPTGDLADINPRDGTIEYVGLSGPFTNDKSIVDVTFRNNDTQEWTIERARISFLLGTEDPSTVDITRRPNGEVVADDLVLGSSLRRVSNATLTDTSDVTFRFDFDDNVGSPGRAFDGLMIITFEARNDAGERYEFTYFIGQ